MKKKPSQIGGNFCFGGPIFKGEVFMIGKVISTRFNFNQIILLMDTNQVRKSTGWDV